MSDSIQIEFDRLTAIFRLAGGSIEKQPPASDEAIASLESAIGFPLSEDLRSLWKISNGSGLQQWICADDDIVDFGYLQPCSAFAFYSVEEAEKWWSLFLPYDDKIYANWHYDGSEGKPDPRVRQTFLRHKKWLPIGHMRGASNTLYCDADPTETGQQGQIIEFIHDPNRIAYKSRSLGRLLQSSNDALELCAKAAPEEFEDEDFSLLEFLTE